MKMDGAGHRCAWRLLISRDSSGLDAATHMDAIRVHEWSGLYETLIHNQSIGNPYVVRSDLAVSVSVPERYRVRAAGLRPEAAALAAHCRGAAVHGVSVLRDDDHVACADRYAARCRLVV